MSARRHIAIASSSACWPPARQTTRRPPRRSRPAAASASSAPPLAGFDPLRVRVPIPGQGPREDFMRTGRGRTAVALATVAITIAAAGGVVAATQSSDEAALQPARGSGGGQQRRAARRGAAQEDDARGEAEADPAALRRADHRGPRRRSRSAASSASPTRCRSTSSSTSRSSSRGCRIPILFAYDTIHGYRTIFPIPLGAGRAFDPNVAATDHRIGARESAAVGLKQIYSPMVDVSHEPRWGRIAEGGRRGPVPRLRVRGRAREGRAGRRLLQARQGRDERQALRRLRPAGGRARLQHDRHVRAAAARTSTCRRSRPRSTPAPTPRCARSTRSTASPAARQRYIETDILKGEWGFDGFIESDYTAVAELIPP